MEHRKNNVEKMSKIAKTSQILLLEKITICNIITLTNKRKKGGKKL